MPCSASTQLYILKTSVQRAGRIQPFDYVQIQPSNVKMTTRQASHAGSWYSSSSAKLSSELEQWLDQVPSSVGDGDVPISGARVIIAP